MSELCRCFLVVNTFLIREFGDLYLLLCLGYRLLLSGCVAINVILEFSAITLRIEPPTFLTANSHVNC
jgi:hypothetical protein